MQPRTRLSKRLATTADELERLRSTGAPERPPRARSARLRAAVGRRIRERRTTG